MISTFIIPVAQHTGRINHYYHVSVAFFCHNLTGTASHEMKLCLGMWRGPQTSLHQSTLPPLLWNFQALFVECLTMSATKAWKPRLVNDSQTISLHHMWMPRVPPKVCFLPLPMTCSTGPIRFPWNLAAFSNSMHEQSSGTFELHIPMLPTMNQIAR